MRRNGHDVERGVSCNDRKFEAIDVCFFSKDPDGQVREKTRRFQSLIVPRDGYRGGPVDHFKVVVDDVVVESTDIQELKRKAADVLMALADGDWEKVLIVRTLGKQVHDTFFKVGDAFGVQWMVGWRVSKLGLVFDEQRKFTLDVYNDDPPPVDEEMLDGFRVTSAAGRNAYRDTDRKTAVIPWTQERQDILVKTVKALGKMKAELDARLLRADAFASMLDATAGKHLLKPPEDA